MAVDVYGNEIDDRAEWEKEWKGMPAFRDPSKSSDEEYGTVIVRFATEKDFKDFCKAIGQDIKFIKAKTKSIWYPKKTTDIVRFYE